MASQVTYPELAADLGYFDDVTLQWVGDTTSGPQDIQSAATGQTEFGGAFNGAIVKLAAGGAPITAVVGYVLLEIDSLGEIRQPFVDPRPGEKRAAWVS